MNMQPFVAFILRKDNELYYGKQMKLNFLKTFFTILAILILPHFSKANDDNIRNFVDNISSRVIEVIESNDTDAQKEINLTRIFTDFMDIDWIGKFAIGKFWNTLNDQQKTSYLQTYKKYLVSSYVPLFRKYNDQKLILKEIKSIGNDQYLVVSEISAIQNSQPYNVQYRIKSTGDKYKIRDIIAEGVSLLTTQRSEFTSIMDQDGLDGLKDKLNEKISSAD